MPAIHLLTLATVIAALVVAAELSNEHNQKQSAEFILAYADWLAVHLQEWMVTTQGDLVPGVPRHYIQNQSLQILKLPSSIRIPIRP